MDKEFEKYIHDTRNEFVKAVNELQWNAGFRTKCENLLIAYDQMKQELRKNDISCSCDHSSYAYTLNNDWKLCDYCAKEFK